MLPSLRLLVKAKSWANSRHLSLAEELLSECSVADSVVRLVEIMKAHPRTEWCDLYVQATGMTDRSYRRHKVLAEKLLRTNGQAFEEAA